MPIIMPLQVWQVDARYCCSRDAGALSLLPFHTKDLHPWYCLAWFNLIRKGEEHIFEIRQEWCLACYKVASGGSTRSRSCWSQETIDNILDALPDELIWDPEHYYLNLAAADNDTENAPAIAWPIAPAKAAAASGSRLCTVAASSRTGMTKPSTKSKGKQPAAAQCASVRPVHATTATLCAAAASSMCDDAAGSNVEVEEGEIDSTLPADMSWEYWSANIADMLCRSRKAWAHALVCAAVRCWGWLKTQTMYACVRATTVTTTSAVSDIASFVERLGGQLHDYVESQVPISTGRKCVHTSMGSEASK
ncbi:hypothetical protein K488DRAFT_91300 [Vararia minispora EC-137]|uniref:Uncharacterized protein n=1 Tax=Vararia minispora EC-137 TaxID=1314806 RepID=A0ACB8Q5Q8_9AGAM|nr:hypothetical protein K488DRAFT_91300 [Vararia minispora EC-137]